MIASLGLVMTHSTDSVRHFIPSEVEYHSIITNSDSPTSTRFNDSHRFSLELLKFNKRKLETFKNFKQGWNGYNAEPIDENLINKIESLISNLDYQPQIFPTGRGSIQIEKYLDENNLIEIEISENEVFAYLVKNGTEFEKEISISEINDYISELYT
ncbi:MAG: hypothetical protein KDC67_13065 [Ignavibacteriae bacterium]|nr:hypothetical protein [Ignavibacteriota bacterium]